MEGLDPETRLKFEEFLSEYQLFSGKESRLIYLGRTDGWAASGSNGICGVQ